MSDLEIQLTAHWERHLAEAELMTEVALHNLGRIASVYSNQLHFDFEESHGTLES